jgi:hypothetical protein
LRQLVDDTNTQFLYAPKRKPDTSECETAHVKRPDHGDLELTIHALHGIFWALEMLVNHRAADKVTHESNRRNGIANLIIAGNLLADEIVERF